MKFLTTVWKVARRIPVTLALAFLVVLTGIITGALWNPDFARTGIMEYGYGLPALEAGQWHLLLLGVAVVTEPLLYLVTVPLFILFAGFIEYRAGAWKMLLVVLSAHIVSVLATLGILALGSGVGAPWATELVRVRDVGLSNLVLGALGAVTAVIAVDQRFRVRLIIILVGLALLLYSGAIWDFTHFIAFLVGLALGPWVFGRSYEKVKLGKDGVSARSLAAGVLVFYAISHIVLKLHPEAGGLLNYPASTDETSLLATTILVVVSLWFAYGLYVGRKIAWWFVVVMTGILLLGDVIWLLVDFSTAGLFSVLYALLLIGVLLIYKSDFRVKSDPATLRTVIVRLLIAGALVAVVHIAIIYSVRESFTPTPSLAMVALESVYQTVGMSTGQFTPEHSTARFTQTIINDVWVLFVLVSVIVIIVATRREPQNEGLILYKKLLEKWGGTTLSWMGTWKKIRFYMNDSETAILAYRLSGNVAIVLSDPIGEKRTTAALLVSFNTFCRDNGWIASYFSVTEKTKKQLAKSGFHSVQVAEDTIVHLKELDFAGKSWQSVRSAINKADKLGVEAQVVEYAQAPGELQEQMQAIEASWAADKALPEMGFTLGTLKEAEDAEVRMIIAVDADGTVHGMTSWLPVYGKGGRVLGWTLDVMQRSLSEEAMPGVIEFLIAKAALIAKDEGYDFISLSGSPLGGSAEDEDLVGKALYWASEKFEPYYGFSSLHRFKNKFKPEYEPLYLCYRRVEELPEIGIAIGRSYMGDISLLKTGVAMLHKQ